MHMHAFVGSAFVYSQHFSPSLLPTQLLGDVGGRAKVGARIWWLIRDVVARQGQESRGTAQ